MYKPKVYYSKPANKYGAKKSMYKNVMYDSKKEMEYAMILDDRLKKKEIKKWERQLRFNLIVKKQKICAYVLDFKVTYPDKRVEYIDVKGMKKGPAWSMFRLKQKLMKACHNIDVIVV